MDLEMTIRITERVFALEDYGQAGDSLKRINERIHDLDQAFFRLFQNLMVDEEQKGKIIDHLGEISLELTGQNIELIHEIDERREEVIRELTKKVNDMNQFTMTITYHETAPTRA